MEVKLAVENRRICEYDYEDDLVIDIYEGSVWLTVGNENISVNKDELRKVLTLL